eukprot:Gb_03825 [translate_table: standard]
MFKTIREYAPPLLPIFNNVISEQGGIHPAYTGKTYLDILHAVKKAVPQIHVHAFSPLEVFQGAATLGISVGEFLSRLKEAGLGSLPGTAAESFCIQAYPMAIHSSWGEDHSKHAYPFMDPHWWCQSSVLLQMIAWVSHVITQLEVAWPTHTVHRLMLLVTWDADWPSDPNTDPANETRMPLAEFLLHVLDDEVRRVLCPDKISTKQWLEVMETAHRLGLRSTATIMFGHVDQPTQWARHLIQIRELQRRTDGFTEFVPLPFVHMEAPLYLKGKARKGPTKRECVLMHSVARLALHPFIRNIQV